MDHKIEIHDLLEFPDYDVPTQPQKLTANSWVLNIDSRVLFKGSDDDRAAIKQQVDDFVFDGLRRFQDSDADIAKLRIDEIVFDGYPELFEEMVIDLKFERKSLSAPTLDFNLYEFVLDHYRGEGRVDFGHARLVFSIEPK